MRFPPAVGFQAITIDINKLLDLMPRECDKINNAQGLAARQD
jgi:hypothetical protein